MLCSMCLILFLTNTISSASELIRLTYGNNSCSGRLEVFYNNEWGTVCDDGWDLSDAAVVCREMGCGDAFEAKSAAFFGQSMWLNISISDVGCVGNESTLSSCSSKKQFNCNHSKDVGVICNSVVRLVNGSHFCSGRVEVFNDGNWGTVCDSGWDYSDAAVICKEMGCGDVFEQRIGGFFGQGSGSVWLSDVQCSNTESTLRQCNLQGWGKNSCGHDKDAAVACQSRIKLENGFNACSGRVEIFYNRYRYNEWGTVCDNNWDLSDAAVVCREMGCGDAIAAKSAAYFGVGWGVVWLDNVNCTGNEFTLAACVSNRVASYDLHYKDAGVICQSLVKLVNGANSCSGRVEVFFNDQWGTVCDNGWDQSDAAIVCKELGCGNVKEAKSAAYFGQGSGPVWLSDVQCASSSTLRNCNSNGWGQSSCGHEKDAGVACELNIRLVNGITSCSGRVEVFRDSQWGTVCDDGWDLSDAAVVCRQMGCGDAIEAKGGAYFGQGVGQILMGSINCFGNETMLSYCDLRRWGMNDHSKDAGVICDPSLRLSNGHNTCSGRVEVLYNGTWGTVCDDHWDLSDAAVVCKEMGCGDAIEAKSAAHFGQGSGPVWISDLQCSNTDSRLRECKSSGWGRGSCGHDKDAGVICKDNVRLVSDTNPCYGRVEVLRANQWGTVCDDGWDASDAAVVCRQLGCGTVLEVKNAAYFGTGSGTVWMNNVNCSGNEPALMSCSHDATPNRCGHEKDAGVICGSVKFMLRVEVKAKHGVDPNSTVDSEGRQLQQWDTSKAELLCTTWLTFLQTFLGDSMLGEASSVRLVDGSSSCSGRVQVLHNEIWGTVCYDGWDLLDANVVCSELGCGEAKEVNLAAFFGQSPEQIWITQVKCYGNESSLTECPANKWDVDVCQNDLYAGVICQPRTRLVGGINSCSGQVEVLYSGTWGKVCDDGWDLTDAAVVCREVGCGGVIEAKSFSYFGEASGQIWMDEVNCSGNEYALSKCEHFEWGVHDCDYTEGAGVICQPVMRLVEGIDACSGRVEVLHNGEWGTVCDGDWGASDGVVVCKEMGCGNIKALTYGAYFGATSGQIWMDSVNCTGEEAALSTCAFQGWGTNDCLFANHAGVMCGLPVRLVQGNSICSGRVEVLRDGQWGTVSDDGWNLTDAAVVCRELGCGDVIEVKGGAYFGQGSGPVWMDSVECLGNESSLIHCKIDCWQNYDLDHLHDAGVICSESFSTSGEPIQGSDTRVKVLLRIEVQTDPMLDPNDARTISKLSEEIEKKLQVSRPFSLIWKTQKDGKVFQDVPQTKKPAGKCN